MLLLKTYTINSAKWNLFIKQSRNSIFVMVYVSY